MIEAGITKKKFLQKNVTNLLIKMCRIWGILIFPAYFSVKASLTKVCVYMMCRDFVVMLPLGWGGI